MFCSNCGKSIPGNLNYCSGCGAATDNNMIVADNKIPGLFVSAGTAIVVFGLIVLYPLTRSLLTSRLEPSDIAVLIIVYLVLLLLMFTVMMTMAWKQLG